MLQAADEIGAGGIHPRHLIYKDNLLPLRQGFQITLQCHECIEPRVGDRHLWTALPDALHEVLQLKAYGNLIHACYIKSIVAADDLLLFLQTAKENCTKTVAEGGVSVMLATSFVHLQALE